MTEDEVASLITASIARHQTRGLTYSEAATGEVVIHGRIDMSAVAAEVIGQLVTITAPRSWAPWFGRQAQRRRRDRKARLAEQARLDEAAADVEAAIARLRLRADAETPPC